MGMMQQAGTPMPEALEAEAPEAEAPEAEGDQAAPEEQAEYERAMAGLYDALYVNDKSSQAVVDMIQPEDKNGSVVKAVVLLVQQLDKKLQLDEVVIPQIAQDATELVVEIAEKAKKVQFSEDELQSITGAVMEGVFQVFGVSPEDAQDFMSSVPPEEQAAMKQEYDGAVAKAPAAPNYAAPQPPRGAPVNG
jgi:hypothetical protein